MISSALFLSAGLLASPVVIQDVQATREAGHLRVEVAGDGGIDPDGARTRIDNGVLLLYLGDTRVKEDNRSWELADGAGEVRAHRHKYEIELVIPLAGNGCDGPVELQGTDSGITALVGCDGAVAPRPPVAKARQAAKQAQSQGKVEELKALIELPSSAAEAPVAAAKPETKPETKTEPTAEAKSAPKPHATDEKTPAEKTPVLKADGKPALLADVLPAEPAVQSAGAGAGTGTSGLRSMGVPALLLALLAAGAYWFARRRRVISVRHIQIIETASLGPKRSLVVARVGGETLILGTSEAGITLLRGNAGLAGNAMIQAATPTTVGELESSVPTRAEAEGAAQTLAAAEAEAAAFEISQPLEEALADIPEPDSAHTTTRGGFRAIEGGLAGLFNGRRGEKAQTDIESEDDLHERFEARLQARLASRRPEAKREESFEDVLEDSVEDQELRRKLAAGMSMRVR
jgi:flagellar protein FliO/FliZ